MPSMPVKFAIEPDALCGDVGFFFDNLLHYWVSNGILVDPHGIHSVRSGNHNVRVEIGSLYLQYESEGWPLWLLTNVDFGWYRMNSPSDLTQYRNEIDVAILEDTRAMVFQVPEGLGSTRRYSKDIGGVEATRLSHISLSSRFKDSVHLAQSNVSNIGRRDLWEERFRKIAACVQKQFTIVDRYAMKNFYAGENEFTNLLEMLDGDLSNDCFVTVFSTRPNCTDSQLDHLIGSKVTALNLQNIRRVTVHLCPQNIFQRDGHDRRVRFGGVTCEIGVGIKIFRGNVFHGTSTFAFKSGEYLQESRDVERILRRTKQNSLIIRV